jgi:DNA mismatch repair protein MutS
MGIQTAAANDVAQHTPMMQQYLRHIQHMTCR